MKESRKTARKAQIEEAAYAVIRENGYSGASMLSVAKRAKASNETLYNWYGDKLGLFSAMVDSNANRIAKVLRGALETGNDPLETLHKLGPVLLDVLTGDRAVALNRAAATDTTGELGSALAQSGRNAVAPLIGETLERARQAGILTFDDTSAATDLFLGLLIGDMQLRCVTGQIDAPDSNTRQERSRRAIEFLQKLLS